MQELIAVKNAEKEKLSMEMQLKINETQELIAVKDAEKEKLSEEMQLKMD